MSSNSLLILSSHLRPDIPNDIFPRPVPTKILSRFRSVTIDGVKGRVVAQAVRRWLPTAAARVRFRAACGVCGGQSGTGEGFIRVFRFPLPISPSS
jgi:hypothetical protein